MKRQDDSRTQGLDVVEPQVLRERMNREVAEKRRRRNRVKRIFRLTVFLGAVSCAAASLVEANRFLTTSEMFATNVVKIIGNERASTEDLVSLAGGPQLGNIFTVDLSAIRSRLLTHGWVKDAAVSRILPRTVEIRVAERTPVAVALTAAGPWLVDASGSRLAQYVAGQFDLPFISGIDRDGGDDALRLGLRVLATLSKADPGIGPKVSEINCAGRSARVVFLDGTPALILGGDEFVERMAFYRKIELDLRARFARIDYVDLRFAPRIYIQGDFRVIEAVQGANGSETEAAGGVGE